MTTDFVEQRIVDPFGAGPARALVKTTRRVPARRAVLWLGQTCNLRCYFCYFLNRISDARHPEHNFMTVEKAREICSTVRDYYGCTAIDIQGGEPTIYPDILDLIRHCHAIGLYPTLITNGLQLAKPGVLEQFRDAGIRDFLVSLHGIGPIHDEVVCRTGAYAKIIVAIERMRELGIPFRFNCTMSKPVIPILPDIARKAIEYGALAVNFIAFNPFADQETGIRTHDNVARYSDIKPLLTEALDLLETAEIEANVRYFPLCMAEERHRKNFYNWQQLPYDHHEWDLQSWLWTGMQTQRMKDGATSPRYRIGAWRHRLYNQDAREVRDWYESTLKGKLFFAVQRAVGRLRLALQGKEYLNREEAILRARDDLNYQYEDGCRACSARFICDGFHGDYAGLHGTGEAQPITSIPLIHDPKHYIRNQHKYVEPEDAEWAL